METLKSKSFSFSTSKFTSKRFSLPYFQNSKQQSSTNQQPQQQGNVNPQSTPAITPAHSDNDTVDRQQRAQKSRSLYITSLKKLTASAGVAATNTTTTSSQKKEQEEGGEDKDSFHPKRIRNSIKRSLSAIVYTTPHQFSKNNKRLGQEEKEESGHHRLVPIIVTPELSETLADSIFIDHQQFQQKQPNGCGCRDSASSSRSSDSSSDTRTSNSSHTEQCLLATKTKEKLVTDYDNTLNISSARQDEKKSTTTTLTITWQGYGFQIDRREREQQMSPAYMKLHYEKDAWDMYKGLVHPLLIFNDDLWNSAEQIDIWSQLTVRELKRYYDNYGSLLLRLHQAKMQQHQQIQ